MRILFLGNSNESLALAPGTPLRHEIMERELVADMGPIEIVLKSAWPTAGFPAVLGRWLTEIKPDLVYINVAEYWSLYESVPLRVEQTFGRLGKPLARAGARSARAHWLAHNRVYQKLREVAQSIVRGGTYFTPQDVVVRTLECIRLCLRNEKLIVVIDGQRGRRPHATTRRGRARVEARRQFVHQRLKAECAKLHVVYGGDDVPQWKTHPEGMDGHRDGLHQAAAGQVWMANEAIALVREAAAAAGWEHVSA